MPPEQSEFSGAFYEMSETFNRDVGPCRRNGITQLLQIGWRYIHAVNSPLHHIPRMLYGVEVWGLTRPLKYTELTVMFQAMFFRSSVVQCW